MKKMLLFCLAGLLGAGQLYAQFQVLGSSTAFEEPESGFCKILNTKEGGTVYLHITPKEGINVRIYDAAHQQKVYKNITPAYGKLKGGDVVGAYEISQNIALFIREFEDRKPVLYRLIIDAHTGALLEEKEIGTLKKLDLGKGYAMAFGHVPMPDFYVRKDPESDNYAVALFNTFASERSERIELVHYNGAHREISRAFYQSPDDEYKYLSFKDMVVMGDREVIALAVGMNTRSSGGDQNGTLLMGSLAAGAKALELNRLDYPRAGHIEGALIRYNKVTGEYILLSVKPVEGTGKSEYNAYKTILKPGSNAPVTTAISAGSLNRIANRHFDKKDQFMAIPQNLYVNDDGSYTIVFEENLMRTYNRFSNGSAFRTATRTQVFLNDIGVIQYNKEGAETAAFYIPKSQQVFSVPDMMYYSYREESAISLSWGIQYKSFYYLNGKDRDYVFINDIEKNQEKIDDQRKVTTIQGLEDCDAYSFAMEKGTEMPRRRLVFGDKQDKKERDIALFTVSAYDREHNVLTTLKRERSGRDKSVKVVWLQP